MENINISNPNDGLGDKVRDAFVKVNLNFTELDNGKEVKLLASDSTKYYRGDKSWQTLDKTAVGLNLVDNTADSNKPVSIPQQNALATKAPLTHTHTVSQITDFPTFKTIENQSIIGAGNIDLDKASVGLGNVDNTSDLNKPISTATQTVLNDLQLNKENKANKNIANGYAGLDSSGKIIPTQLPALAITDTFVVASQAEQLALVAEVGDVAVRTDLNKSFILRVTGASTLANWQELLSPTTVDQTIIDGSTNSVSGNAVFDALATKAPISSVHNPVTLGTPNGLSLSTQQLSLGLASSGVTGALSGTDWNTFNGKFNTPTGLTTNYLPKWNGSGFGNSQIFDDGTNIGIGTTNPTANLTVKGAYSVGSSIPTDWALLSAGRMGVAKNNKGLYFDIFNDYAEVSTYDWSLGQAYPMVFQGNGGNSMFGTNVDNGSKVQVNGTISASPATTANQVPTWGQVQAIAKPYKVYTALLNQTGTNAPVATVLENTLGGTVTFERTGVGNYSAVSGNLFTLDKTVVFNSSGQFVGTYNFYPTNTSRVLLNNVNVSGVVADSLMQKLSIEIRVYL